MLRMCDVAHLSIYRLSLLHADASALPASHVLSLCLAFLHFFGVVSRYATYNVFAIEILIFFHASFYFPLEASV